MSKTKIPDLQNATLPLTGTESVIVEQAGFTREATVEDVIESTGARTIPGAWTFSSSPNVPAPTSGTSSVNKDYVDGVASGGLYPSMFTFMAIRNNTISASFPYARLDNGAKTLSTTTYPGLLDLYNQAIEVYDTDTVVRDSWSCTVAGSVVTFPATANLPKGLLEMGKALANSETPSYIDCPPIEVNGTLFAISSITGQAVTVTGSPTTGTQTVKCYNYRKSGVIGSVYIPKTTGIGLMAAGDINAYFISGLMRRGFLQSHVMYQGFGTMAASSPRYGKATGVASVSQSDSDIQANSDQATNATITSVPQSDGTNGTPRLGKETHGPSLAAYLYMYVGAIV